MTENETKGGLTIELDGDDIKYLTKRGRSTVTKEIGPIQVKVRCDNRVYPHFVMEDATGNVVDPEVFEDE
jgi:hypothetical protein